MRRPYRTFLLASLLPSTVAVAAAAVVVERSWTGAARISQARAGQMAQVVLEQDRDVSQGAADPGLPDPPPSVVRALGMAGFAAAVYVDGHRHAGTVDAPPGPEALEPAVLERLAASPGGLTLPPGGREEGPGLLVPRRTGDVGDPSMAVLIGFPADHPPLLPRPLLLVATLVLVFAAVAAWIQLGGRPPRQLGRWLFLVSLVPVLTASSFIVHVDRLHQEAALAAQRRDLGRALAVARARGSAGEPGAVQALTGYHAFRVRGGAVVAATLDGPAPAVAGLRTPPPNFTSAGKVQTPEGASSYVAVRLGEGDFVVASAAAPGPSVRDTRTRLRWMALALWGWLALAWASALVRRRAVSS